MIIYRLTFGLRTCAICFWICHFTAPRFINESWSARSFECMYNPQTISKRMGTSKTSTNTVVFTTARFSMWYAPNDLQKRNNSGKSERERPGGCVLSHCFKFKQQWQLKLGILIVIKLLVECRVEQYAWVPQYDAYIDMTKLITESDKAAQRTSP